jgi:hypothetical protein
MDGEKRWASSRRGFADRFDDLVQRASQHLARPTSRRGFLSRIGAGAAALGASGLLQPSSADAATDCILPVSCYGTHDVNVCYSPWKVTGTEPGQTNGVVMRKGPSFDADPVLHADGTLGIIPVGGTVGRVSNRTGSVAGGCPDPGPRAAQNGFVWGYWLGFKKQVWIPHAVGGVAYSIPDPGYTGNLCGPASADFDCRKAKTDCASYNGCGGNGVGSPTCSATYRPVIAVGTDLSEEKYYLRYAANSTTFGWFVPGDRVLRFGFKDGAGFNWSCVQVICAKHLPSGCRGWVRSDALGNPITDHSKCFPKMSCPPGSKR